MTPATEPGVKMDPELARLFAVLSGILFFILCVVLLEHHNHRLRLEKEAGEFCQSLP